MIVTRTHEHTWKLTEGGYIRTWETELTDDGRLIATYTGPSDWTDDGDGQLYLACSWCGAERSLPDVEVEWK